LFAWFGLAAARESGVGILGAFEGSMVDGWLIPRLAAAVFVRLVTVTVACGLALLM